jgi:hypothetical protein
VKFRARIASIAWRSLVPNRKPAAHPRFAGAPSAGKRFGGKCAKRGDSRLGRRYSDRCAATNGAARYRALAPRDTLIGHRRLETRFDSSEREVAGMSSGITIIVLLCPRRSGISAGPEVARFSRRLGFASDERFAAAAMSSFAEIIIFQDTK